jgi:AraC-like DNA-binding protein
MVIKGHFGPTMRRRQRPTEDIPRVRYEAPAGYDLDVEIFSLGEFRRRVTKDHLRNPQRVEFHLLVAFTEGRCQRMIDFVSYSCRRGTLLLLRPGQIQQFDVHADDWDGWMIMFRPEFIPSAMSGVGAGPVDLMQAVNELPAHRHLSGPDQQAVLETLSRMAADARSQPDTVGLRDLLRHTLLALLSRLVVIARKDAPPMPLAPAVLRQFGRYRLAVEREFTRLHRVGDYAKLIGCTPKTLQRACMAAAGVSAKAYLSERVALEAKRLLVHTDQPVSAVSDLLGFDEVTNFVKFFRRLSGAAPGAFRARHRPG